MPADHSHALTRLYGSQLAPHVHRAAVFGLIAALSTFLVAGTMPHAVAADGDAAAKPRTMRDPVLVAINLPAPSILLDADRGEQHRHRQELINTVNERAAEHPDRLIILNPMSGSLRYGGLPERDRELIEREHGRFATAAYERSMAYFLDSLLGELRNATSAPAFAIMGLPLEPVHTSVEETQAVNEHYAHIIEQLDAFAQPHSFILYNSGISEMRMVQQRLPESLRLSDGQPIIFRTNGVWRIATPQTSNVLAADHFAGLDDGAANDLFEKRIASDPSTASQPTGAGTGQDATSPAGSGAESGGGMTSSDGGATANAGGSSGGSTSTSPSTDAGLSSSGFGGATGGGGGGGGGGGRRGNQNNNNNSNWSPSGEVADGESDQDTSDSGSSGSGGSGGDGGDGGGGIDTGSGWTSPGCDEPDYDSWENVHPFTGLPMTCDGWTDFTAMVQHPDHYNDSRIIYVSSSAGSDLSGAWYSPGAAAIGDDPFNPVGAVQPYRTIAAAYANLRNGFPDIMLIRRGDTFTGAIGSFSKSGRSQIERMIVATYGPSTVRPTFNIGSSVGINTSGTDHLIVSGLGFYSHTWQSTSVQKGVDILSGGSGSHHQLHEDCVYERVDLVRVQGSDSNQHNSIAFRRSHFISTYDQSVYASRANGLLLEENIFFSSDDGEDDRRFLYLSPAGPENKSLTNVTVRGNIFYQGTNTGLSIRSGGLIEDNLIIRNDQMLVGGWGGSQDSIHSVIIRNNVFLESSIGSGDGETSIRLVNIDGGEVYGNIWTDDTSLGSSSYALVFGSTDNLSVARNIDIHHNIIHGWAGDLSARALRYPGGFDVENVTIRENDFQMVTGSSDIIQHLGDDNRFDGYTYSQNRYYSTANASSWFTPGGTFAGWTSASGETGAVAQQISYSAATRNLKTYHVSVGRDPSTEQFILEARNQSRGNWRPEYSAASVNAYIRQGFDLPANGISP